jgi:uncharacterized protein (DUF1697 family)
MSLEIQTACTENEMHNYAALIRGINVGGNNSLPMAVLKSELNAMELQTSTEQTSVWENVFYLLAPDGIGRSKLAAKVEKIISKSGTARIWNTVEKIQNMLADFD